MAAENFEYDNSPEQTGKSLTSFLAELAIGTKCENIPEKAYTAAKKVILDTIGVTIAGYNAESINEVIKQTRDWAGKEEATVLIHGGKFPAPLASFTNCAMAHAHDFDQTHQMGVGHVMVSLMPVSMAAAEMAGASGREFLAAVILGQEVTCRLGFAFQKQKPKDGYSILGFLPASVIGGFGTTAAACRLLGMNIEQTIHAMGINYAQAAGNRQALFEKTLTKRLQPAFAARSALWAANLARMGITGPVNALEGKAGLFRLYRKAPPCSVCDLMEPRSFYEIERDSIKPHPCCPTSDTNVAVHLGSKHRFKPEDIELIQVHMPSTTGSLTSGRFRFGANLQASAQFSTAYCIALGVLRGKAGLEEFRSEQILSDKEVIELAGRVVMAPIEELPEAKPLQSGLMSWAASGNRYHGVKVRTKDGRTYSCFRTHREILGPETSMKMENISVKFHECARFSGICPEKKTEEIINAVMKLDAFASISQFIENYLILNRERNYGMGRK